MLKEVFLLVKYPYTAGVIAIIWLSTGALLLIEPTLPIGSMVSLNIGVTLLISLLGFRGKSQT